MDDFTDGCLDSARVKDRKLNEKELRGSFCRQCKNYKCGHARWGVPGWEERIQTQEDRLLNNPNFGSTDDPKFSHIREVDFPDLVKKAIMLETADKKGDWSLPNEFDAINVFVENEENPQKMKNPVVENKREIKINSKTKKGFFYTVTIVDGAAIGCDCAAGRYGKNCTHLGEALNVLSAESGNSSSGGVESDEEIVENLVVELTEEEKLNLGGITKMKNTQCNPHGIMINNVPVDENPMVDKKEKDLWGTKRETTMKPGSTIKL